MALPLNWNEGEGYDIHVLRGGPPSKALDDRLEPSAFSPSFSAHFKGAPSNFGVTVNEATGEVTAEIQPPEPQPKHPNFNFLMTARRPVLSRIRSTVIRIHVHDSVRKIWLTPSTLTVHKDAEERRFTVLALFDDGVIGDITDWSKLVYVSADPSVSVANTGDLDPFSLEPVALGGAFNVNTPGGSSVITVKLNLNTPRTNLSDSATVLARSAWSEGGKNAKVQFIAGPVAPIQGDVDPSSSSNVHSVIKNARNILFLAEGFRKEGKREFDKMVRAIVRELRTKDYLLPFKLLRDSINYWSVFVQSNEEVISILGDQQIDVVSSPVPLPLKPTSAQWTVENMIHEGGLPMPQEASAPDPAAWVASRNALHDLSNSNPVITSKELDAWNALKSRSLLNERDTAFGLAHYDRPRASSQDQSEWRLRLDRRRTREGSLQLFIENLTFGKDPTTSSPIEIGGTWLSNVGRGSPVGKDAGLVCIIGRDDTRGGAWVATGSSLPLPAYFAATAGMSELAGLTAAANGHDIRSLAAGRPFSAPILASRVARGCGHALGLGDESGNHKATGFFAGLSPEPNLEHELSILTSPVGAAPRVIDATKIKWLWPRIIKSGVIDVQFDPNSNLLSPEKCDPNGTPNPNGSHLRVRMRIPSPEPFVPNDVVRIRAASLNLITGQSWILPSEDHHAGFALFVQRILNDIEIIVGYQNPRPAQLGYLPPSGTQIDLASFTPLTQYLLIAPRIEAGKETQLVAAPIRMHVDSSDGPLNAPLGSRGAACVQGSPAFDHVTPTNLPQGPTVYPYALADIIGLYEGGGQVDCGVFRPAGRCKMRGGFDDTMPFCHVCRYIIVDQVDPTMHGALDKFYPEVRS